MSNIKTMNEEIYTGRVETTTLEKRLRDHIVGSGAQYDAEREAAYKNVNHPDHYTQGGIEAIDAIQAALTPEEFRGYCKGNALKYIWRERMKGQDESIRKAIWYLNRMLGE